MDYRSLAYKTAQKYGIDPDIFVRQIQAESAFDPAAVSSAGAIGLGQLMPATAKELGVDPTDPAQNLEGAARYMKQLLGRYDGNQTLALAAYNAGMGNVDKAGGVPNFKETQNYIAKIMGSNMAQQPTQPQQPQQPQQQGLLGGILGGQGIGGALGLSDDFRDRLKMGILLGSDPRAFAPMVQAIQARGEERRQQAKAVAGRNATADYLEKIGQTDLADLLRKGGISASAAFGAIPSSPKDTALIKQAKAAGLKEGTPEFQQYILSGGDIYSKETALLSNLPTPEKGKMYEFDRDDAGNVTNIRLVSIEGSKAQIEEAQRQEKIQKTRTMEQRGQSVVSRSVQEALNILDTDTGVIPVAGTYGKFAADYLPDQEARNLKRTLEALQANTAFTRLQEMRDASQTGGALGNVSNVELGLLMSAYGSISQDLDPSLLRKNLKQINEIMGKIENDPIASAFYNEGVDLRGSDLDRQVKSSAPKSGSAKRLRFDAQGNIIND